MASERFLDELEDGNGSCTTEEFSPYDAETNPDPNSDNLNLDPNEDNHPLGKLKQIKLVQMRES